MSRPRKYPKLTGNWVYGHITPNGKIYIGCSGDKYAVQRWNPNSYKGCSLYTYIEKYGWDNIKHIVFKDGLTKEQAKQLEDLLITQAKIDGWCINRNRSGNIATDLNEWQKNWEREYRKKIENIIYYRVDNYNKYNTPIETAKEAKQKYLETGYIPNYIKNKDLIMKG